MDCGKIVPGNPSMDFQTGTVPSVGQCTKLSIPYPKEERKAILTSRQVVGKLESADIVGGDTGESGRQIQRYIRLTELLPELLKMVDEKQIKFNAGVEISYLTQDEQKDLLIYQAQRCFQACSQAVRLLRI